LVVKADFSPKSASCGKQNFDGVIHARVPHHYGAIKIKIINNITLFEICFNVIGFHIIQKRKQISGHQSSYTLADRFYSS